MVDRHFGVARPYRLGIGLRRGLPRPMLRVRLHHGRATAPPFVALVDSGADVSAFEIGVARRLGIDLAFCRTTTVGAVGGSLTAYACDVDLEIEGQRFPIDARFVPMPIALLGRQDVFARFLFAFDQRALRLLLEPY